MKSFLFNKVLVTYCLIATLGWLIACHGWREAVRREQIQVIEVREWQVDRFLETTRDGTWIDYDGEE